MSHCDFNETNFCLTHGEYGCLEGSGLERCMTGPPGLNSPTQHVRGYGDNKKSARQLDDRIIKSLRASSVKCGLLLSKESSEKDIGKSLDPPQLTNTSGKRILESKGLI